jgi:hypothetical protein
MKDTECYDCRGKGWVAEYSQGEVERLICECQYTVCANCCDRFMDEDIDSDGYCEDCALDLKMERLDVID